MIQDAKPARVLYENLDTSFVNLWALLRYLSQRSFRGRVHVELEDYSADIFLNGTQTPMVHEIDRSTGTEVIEEAALHRLVLRVRESPGSITVYEGAAAPVASASDFVQPPAEGAKPEAPTPAEMRASAGRDDDPETVVAGESVTALKPIAPTAAGETVRVAGELVAGVEQAVASLGFDFKALFREARISLADDYPFLDPMAGRLRYENAALTSDGESVPQGFVTAITETLRRVADKIATGEKARRARERIALELARVARKNDEALTRSGFRDELDRIAGTKVL